MPLNTYSGRLSIIGYPFSAAPVSEGTGLNKADRFVLLGLFGEFGAVLPAHLVTNNMAFGGTGVSPVLT